MIFKRENMVNTLITKDSKIQPADVSLDDVTQLFDNFNKAFERDMLNSGVEKFIEKYAIESPFDEISDSFADNRSMRSIARDTAKSKWDLINLTTFSPKYMTALDRMKSKNINGKSDITAEENKWKPADEEWKSKTKDFINSECCIDITWPDGFYDNIKRSYAILGLKKKMPWIVLSKTTTKTVSDRFKKGRTKESLRNGVTLEPIAHEEEVLEPPPWDEVEKMREKCLEWLAHHEKSDKVL